MTDVTDWKLTDFLPLYPDIETENLQTLISAKKEFIETASSINEPRPELGELYKNQQFVLRYLKNYNEVLLADQPGVGKTCSELSITEYVKDEFLKSLNYDVSFDVKNSHYKKTIVLLKGTGLSEEFKTQLACKCTKDKYDFRKLIEGKTLDKINPRKIVKKEIEKWYVFYTYETFAKHIEKKYGDDYGKMRIDYNHTIIIIDEAHNLFIDDDTDKNIKEDNKWNKDKTYQVLHWFFHHVEYCKKILATATPMLNMMSEFGKLMNLILPEKLQMPVRKDFKDEKDLEKYYKNITVKELNDYISGRVIFVRAFDTGATRIDMVNKNFKCKDCPDINPIYMTEMSKFQSKIYKEVLETKGSSAYSLYLNYASNFVFPDGSFSEPEKNKITINKKKVKDIKKNAMKNIPGFEESDSDESNEEEESKTDDESNTDITEEDITEEDITEEESTEEEVIMKNKGKNKKGNTVKTGYNKYVIEESIGKKKKLTVYKLNKAAKPPLVLDTIEDVRKHACKYATIIEALESKGSSFIYGRYNKGSGNIMLGLCMEEAAGYERFIETESVFETKEKKVNFCEDTKVERTLKSDFVKKKRYALLTSDVLENDAAFYSMMELMNSYENRHGEYLKCVIASRVARDGLNFKNIIKIFLTGPDWNPSSMYQAISRGIRTASHNDLLLEYKQIDIDVYQLAAVPNQKILKNLGVDIHIYDVAHQKDINISHLFRKIIQCTIGCQIQYKRNVRDTDVDYSSSCYYDKCKYKCVDPAPKEIDYTTYNAYYIQEDVMMLNKLLILNLVNWTNGKIFRIEDLYNYIPENYTLTCLRLSLQQLINDKIQIRDLYGFISYLYQDNGNYYLSREYKKSDIASFIYTNQLIVSRNVMNEFFEELNTKNYEHFLTLKDDISLHFNMLNVDNKNKFLENQYINPDPIYDDITSQYTKLFFKMNELKLNDKPVKAKLSPKNKGRPKKSELVGKEVKTDRIVYINMLNLYKETNKHNFIPFYFKANTNLRIYNPDENVGWRDVTPSEQDMYSKKIIVLNNKKFNKMQVKHNNLFGIDIGGEMLIVYEEETGKKKKIDEGVSRSEARGRKCESYNKEKLEEIALKLKIDKDKLYTNNKLKTIDQLCVMIKSDLVNQDRLF
jgi:hypothetical protein